MPVLRSLPQDLPEPSKGLPEPFTGSSRASLWLFYNQDQWLTSLAGPEWKRKEETKPIGLPEPCAGSSGAVLRI